MPIKTGDEALSTPESTQQSNKPADSKAKVFDGVIQTPVLLSTLTMFGPMNEEQFKQHADILPQWVNSAAEKTFAHTKDGQKPFNSVVLILDELQDLRQPYGAVIPGVFDGKDFSAYRYFSFEDSQLNQTRPLHESGTNRPLTLKVNEFGDYKEIDKHSVVDFVDKTHGTLWPGYVKPTLIANIPHEAGLGEYEHEYEHQRLAEHGHQRMDQLIYEQLEKHDGVFLGECHVFRNMRETITYLMPALKARGVNTISLEIFPECVDIIKNSRSAEEAVHRLPSFGEEFCQSFFMLIKQAEKNGVKVIGHERLSEEYLETLRTGAHHNEAKPLQDEKMRLFLEERIGDSQRIAKRDTYSAAYIREHQAPGKIVVLGGAAHSTHLNLERDNAYHGINKLLGIPSIDIDVDEFKSTYEREVRNRMFSEGIDSGAVVIAKMGDAAPNLASGSDFVVNLPTYVKGHMLDHIKPGEYEGHSWPPLRPGAREAGPNIALPADVGAFKFEEVQDTDKVLKPTATPSAAKVPGVQRLPHGGK